MYLYCPFWRLNIKTIWTILILFFLPVTANVNFSWIIINLLPLYRLSYFVFCFNYFSVSLYTRANFVIGHGAVKLLDVNKHELNWIIIVIIIITIIITSSIRFWFLLLILFYYHHHYSVLKYPCAVLYICVSFFHLILLCNWSLVCWVSRQINIVIISYFYSFHYQYYYYYYYY
jgi:hypothetical protein